MTKLTLWAKLGVLAFASAASLLPTAAAALPTHERLVFYLDGNGQYIGELLTTCNGRRYYSGSTSSNIQVVYEEPCEPPTGNPGCGYINGLWYCP